MRKFHPWSTAVLLVSVSVSPLAVAASPEQDATTVAFPYMDVYETSDEHLGTFEVDVYGDELGIAYPEEMLCSPDEIWFDSACRSAGWFEANVALPGGMVALLGSRLKASGTSHVLVTEQIASDTFDRTLISDDAPTSGLALAGPSRSGYPIESIVRQSMIDQGGNSFVALTETLEPVFTMEAGWQLETVDVESAEFGMGAYATYCGAEGCALVDPDLYSCERIREALTKRLYAQCIGSTRMLTAVVLGSAGSAMAGIGAGILITLAGGGTTVAPGVAAGIAIVGMGTGTITSAAHLVCDSNATDEAVGELVALGCVDPTPGSGGGTVTPDDPDDGQDDPEEAGGCRVCDEWEMQITGSTASWDPETGECTVTGIREPVCVSDRYDALGTDSNGDGWCDD